VLAVVFGSGRSGTTLVDEMLTRHEGTGFVANLEDKLTLVPVPSKWNGRIYRRMGPKDPSHGEFKHRRSLWEKGRLRLAPTEAWELMNRQISGIWARPCRDLVTADATPWQQQRFRDFFEQRMAAQGCEVFVAHWTGWPRAGFADASMPGTRFVHVVRDGRAVASSWLQMGWWDGYQGPSKWFLGDLNERDQADWDRTGRSFPALAGIGWRLLMDAFETARQQLPAEQWLQVRYEDVLDRPREEFGRMLDFLGLEWTPAFEAGYARHSFPQGRRAAYERDLAPADVAVLDDLLGPTLERLGYAARQP
jgi:hypothetical protein